MKKVGLLVIVLLVSLSIMGAAYGSWTHGLEIAAEVQTLGAPMIMKALSSDDNSTRVRDPEAASPGTWGPAPNADIPRWTCGTYVKDSLNNICTSARTSVPVEGPVSWQGAGFSSTFTFDVQVDAASYGTLGQFKNSRYGGSVALSIHNPNDIPLTVTQVTAVVSSLTDPAKVYFCTSSGASPVLGGALAGAVVIPAYESRLGTVFITVDGLVPRDEAYQITVTFITST